MPSTPPSRSPWPNPSIERTSSGKLLASGRRSCQTLDVKPKVGAPWLALSPGVAFVAACALKSILRSFAPATAIAHVAGSAPARSVSRKPASNVSSSASFKALNSFASMAKGRVRSKPSARPAVRAFSEELGQLDRRSPSAWTPSTAILASGRSFIHMSGLAPRGTKSRTHCLSTQRHGRLLPTHRRQQTMTSNPSIERTSSGKLRLPAAAAHVKTFGSANVV